MNISEKPKTKEEIEHEKIINERVHYQNIIKKFKAFEKEEKDREPEPLTPDHYSKLLLQDIQSKIEEVDHDRLSLQNMHYKQRIKWKKAVMSAIESFKDFKLESVDEYKAFVPQKPFTHENSFEFIKAAKDNQFDKVK